MEDYTPAKKIEPGCVMDKEIELKACPIKMVEISGGKDPAWKGWYNLLINDEDGHPIAGPIHPDLSKPFLEVIEAWNTRALQED